MLTGVRASAYCTLAALLLTGPPVTAQTPSAPTAATTFNVFVRSMPVGFERIELVQDIDGWTIRSRGDLAHPINLQNRRFEIKYDEQWSPRSLDIQGIRNDAPFSLQTTFDETGATSVVEQAGQRANFSTPTSADAVVLPEYFFAAYEAFAARLAGAEIGDQFSVFVPRQGATSARLAGISTSRIEMPSAVINARVHNLLFEQAGAPVAVAVWTDAGQRLVRVTIPLAGLDVAREDVVSVSARVRQVSHTGDEDTRIGSEGFSLAVTITTPVDRPRPVGGWPAVLLVASSSSTDRDGTVSGVPILGQIANALADAGYLTLRYDRRGSGQSGGRSESATIETHADDARALVRYLDRRDDVDQDRITLLGHDDGGWVAIIAARRERRADNLVLVGTPAGTGTELILEQQRAALDQLAVPEAERAENIRLQRQIHDAVLDGGTWNGVPEAMRSQADTPWFRSFLEFDAADTLRRTRQPLLILRGSLDQQAGPHHAEQLEVVARTRRREATVEVLTLDGLDHLLVETESSDQPAYGDLSRSSVSQLFTNRLINWLARTR